MTDLEEKYTLLLPSPHSHSACGAILKVQNKTTKEVCALKVSQTRLHKNTAHPLSNEESKVYAQLLENEIVFLHALENLIGNLEDNHILPILDDGTWKHDPFEPDKQVNPLPAFVMPLGESSLQNIVTGHYIKNFEDIFSIDIFYIWAMQILKALSALESIPEELGMFSHRDMKPDNIIVWKNNLYLIDFGISRYNEEGRCTTLTGAGTLGWIAPEQGIPHKFIVETVNGQKIHVPLYRAGHSVDIYTTGHILYWLVTRESLACQKTIDSAFNKGEPHKNAVRLFENIKGVSTTELERLKSSLQSLIDKKRNETIAHVKNEYKDLHRNTQKIIPNADYIVDTTVKIIKSMLEIKAHDRICATKALASLNTLYGALRPRIEKFSLSGPDTVVAGHPFVLTVSITGTYPLTNGPCFTVYVGDTKVENIEAKEHFDDIASIPETGTFTWYVNCSPLKQENTVECYAEIYFDAKLVPNMEVMRSQKTITVIRMKGGKNNPHQIPVKANNENKIILDNTKMFFLSLALFMFLTSFKDTFFYDIYFGYFKWSIRFFGLHDNSILMALILFYLPLSLLSVCILLLVRKCILRKNKYRILQYKDKDWYVEFW